MRQDYLPIILVNLKKNYHIGSNNERQKEDPNPNPNPNGYPLFKFGVMIRIRVRIKDFLTQFKPKKHFFLELRVFFFLSILAISRRIFKSATYFFRSSYLISISHLKRKKKNFYIDLKYTIDTIYTIPIFLFILLQIGDDPCTVETHIERMSDITNIRYI